jgi:hypothetical protein
MQRKSRWRDNESWIRWSAWLLMSVTPALGTFVLIKQMGVSLAKFVPATSDEVGYYLQINAFAHHGFSGGYFTISEHPAPASFSHFGVHGPMFPLLYGALGKLFGWHFYSGPLFNVSLVCLAVSIFCLTVQPTVWQALLGTAFLATFWPFYMALVSLMQDPIHWAIAILIAAGFAGMLRQHPWSRTWLFQCCFLAILVYGSLMRISWAMFLVPYAMLLVRKPTWGKLTLAAFIGVMGIGALVYLFRLLCAPFVGAPGAFLMNKIAGGEVSAQTVLEHARHNIELLAGPLWKKTDVPGKVIYVQAVGLGLIAASYAVFSLGAGLLGYGNPRPTAVEYYFHAFAIWGMFFGIICFYLVYNSGGWRMLAVHLLVCGLIATTSNSHWIKAMVMAIVMISAVALPRSALSIQAMNRPRFAFGPTVRYLAPLMERLMPYREGANPWCNTILTDCYPVEFLALPAGIGVSFYRGDPEDLKLPIKSQYVLAREKGEYTGEPAWFVAPASKPLDRMQRRPKKIARFAALYDGMLGHQVSANLYVEERGAGLSVQMPSIAIQGVDHAGLLAPDDPVVVGKR